MYKTKGKVTASYCQPHDLLSTNPVVCHMFAGTSYASTWLQLKSIVLHVVHSDLKQACDAAWQALASSLAAGQYK